MKRWPWLLVILSIVLSVLTPLVMEPYLTEAAAPGLEVSGNLDLGDKEKAMALKKAVSDSMQLRMYGLVAQLVYGLMFIVGLVASIGALLRARKKRKRRLPGHHVREPPLLSSLPH